MDPLLRDCIEWDVPNWALALEFWRHKSALDWQGKQALEIGGRNGGLSLWAAKQGLQVICSDLDGPTERAHQLHIAHQVTDKIEYAEVNAVEIPYENHFDIVLFKSVLGGVGENDKLERARTAVTQMHKALKPGGELWFAENLEASPMHRLLRRKFVHWGKRWNYISIESLQEFMSVFSSFEYRTAGFLGALGQCEQQRNFLSSLDRYFLARMVPEKWRYIMIGVARK